MSSILPIIPISDLQKKAKACLAGIQDYAVIRSHHTDVAFVLHPALGRILLESNMLQLLKEKAQIIQQAGADTEKTVAIEKELQELIGRVLRELSKK